MSAPDFGLITPAAPPHDITTTEEGLLSCLMLPDTGAETLLKCRDAGLTDQTFTVPQYQDLYRRIAAQLDAGKREAEIQYAVGQDAPEHAPTLDHITGEHREPTSLRAPGYIQKLRAAEIKRERKPILCAAPPDDDEDDGNGRGIDPMEIGSDNDAAARFAVAHAHELRFCPGVGWLYWDGKRWATDADGRALELSKKEARAWTVRWSRFNGDNREDKLKSAIAFESASHLKAAVELAKCDPRLVVPVSKLDCDPWKLNVHNGTLDLRTGKLGKHNRDDFLTKLAPVTYAPDAANETVGRYLSVLESAVPGMSAFLARCFGAALTGDASAETLFLLQGDGGSGKTTLMEAIAAMLGDYAAKLQFESFCLSRHGRAPGAASPDLMPLRGARLAHASEGDQSARLDAGKIKEITGNEPLTVRGLYAAPITFPQTWKLWLVSNFDPKTDSEDTGIWRRMMKLHFAVIPEDQRDPEVKRTLTTDAEARAALLSWALTGCIDWQARGGGRVGLAPPDSVKTATEAYRIKQDSLAEWWDDLLATGAELQPVEWEPVSAVRANYDEWCNANSALPVFIKRFNAYLESKGLQQKRGTGGVRRWHGIKLSS